MHAENENKTSAINGRLQPVHAWLLSISHGNARGRFNRINRRQIHYTTDVLIDFA